MIGVAITTRGRPQLATQALQQWRKHSPGIRVTLVDDGTPQAHPEATIHLPTNMGISAAKNAALRTLDGCEHIFLADDDVWPIADGWWKPYLDFGQPHSQLNWGGEGRGVLLYMHRSAVDRVGGFDRRFARRGMEHWNLAERIHNAGLTDAVIQGPDSGRMFRALDRDEPRRHQVRQNVWDRWFYLAYGADRHQQLASGDYFVDYSASRTVDVCIPWRPGPGRERIFQTVTSFWSYFGFNVITADSPNDTFSVASARNSAVDQSAADVVVVADADVIPDPGLIRHLAHNPDGVWLPYDEYKYMPHNSDPTRWTKTEPYFTRSRQNKLSCGGLWIVPRATWHELGGNDERCTQWGYEDDCFKTAAETLSTFNRVKGVMLGFAHEAERDMTSANPGRSLYGQYRQAKGNPAVMRELVKGTR